MGNKVKLKTPELLAAKRALIAYFKEHNLNPSDRSLTKDPVHGRILTDLINKLNKERDKVMANYPVADRSNNLKLLKMAKKEKKAKAQEVKETPKKEKKSAGRTTTKYDYPQVKDEKTGKMRDMTSDEKKKYRVEARKKAKGDTTPNVKKEKKVEAPATKVKTPKKEEKKAKKKVKKEED